MSRDRDGSCGFEWGAECRDTFWVEAPFCLLTDFRVIPREEMTLEQKMNTITRIVILVFLVMLIAKYKHAMAFLLISIVLIVILYYAKRRRVDEEYTRSHSKKQKEHSHGRMSSWDVEHDYSPERIYAHAGNGREEALQAQERYPERFMATAGSDDDEDYETMASGKKVHQKSNPRRPFPPTVPADLIVKAGRRNVQAQNQATIRGRIFNTAPEMAQYVPSFGQKKAVQAEQVNMRGGFQREPAPSETAVRASRDQTMKKAYLGTPKNFSRYHGYQVQDFQDDAEQEDEQQEEEPNNDALYYDVPEMEEVVQTAVAPKRRFLPANYDPSQDLELLSGESTTNVMVPGPGRRLRRVPHWGDNNQNPNKIDAAEIMFTKAAQIEKATNARFKIDRASHINTALSL